MILVIEALASFFLILGSTLFLIAAVGLFRLPDAMCRAHAVAKGTSLGILLLLVALGIFIPEARLMAILVGLFQMCTIPIAGHLLGRLAFRKKIPLWKERSFELN